MSNPTTPSFGKQMLFIAFFFFVFGFVTWINGALIPYLRIACQLEEWQTYLVTFAFYIAYTATALPAGWLLQRTGTTKGMQIGLGVMAVGCALFIPAALAREYGVFLAGLFFVGVGLTILQIAVNPYVTLLGPINRAAQRISIVGACNKFAGVLAPLIFGTILLADAGNVVDDPLRLDELSQRVIAPYLWLSLSLMALALLVRRMRLPEIESVAGRFKTDSEPLGRAKFRGRIAAGFLAIFCTVGAEVVAGDTIGNYGLYHGLATETAGILASATLAAMMTGYLLGIAVIPKYMSQERAFIVANLLATVVLASVLTMPGIASVYAVAALGFANALLWPAIWPQTLKGLQGRQLHLASAVLIMGIAGGAVMPLVYGAVASIWNGQDAYAVLFVCYGYNCWFWYRGKEQTPKTYN